MCKNHSAWLYDKNSGDYSRLNTRSAALLILFLRKFYFYTRMTIKDLVYVPIMPITSSDARYVYERLHVGTDENEKRGIRDHLRRNIWEEATGFNGMLI